MNLHPASVLHKLQQLFAYRASQTPPLRGDDVEGAVSYHPSSDLAEALPDHPFVVLSCDRAAAILDRLRPEPLCVLE